MGGGGGGGGQNNNIIVTDLKNQIKGHHADNSRLGVPQTQQPPAIVFFFLNESFTVHISHLRHGMDSVIGPAAAGMYE